LLVFFTGKDTLVFMAYQHDQPVLLVGEEHSEEHQRRQRGFIVPNMPVSIHLRWPVAEVFPV
jgi:hypothetical protein